MGLCEKCRYYNEDWAYDGETNEDFCITSCDKGMNEYLEPLYDGLEKCPRFKEYPPDPPYREPEPTECDYCNFRDTCNNVIDVTSLMDMQSHYARGSGYCEKEHGAINEKTLSWLVENAEKMGIYSFNVETLEEIIAIFGDMTFGEMQKRATEIHSTLMGRENYVN